MEFESLSSIKKKLEIFSRLMHGGHSCTEYIATIQISSSSFKAENIGDVEKEMIKLI